jgi:DNA-binding NarL/FixJ family response regulator
MHTILIVDDHPSWRLCARETLEAEGFDVVGEADTGASALDAAARLRPDVVLLDVQLPDMTGFDVAGQLTASGNRQAVVLVSSREEADYGPLIERSGARGFIAKADLTVAALEALLR